MDTLSQHQQEALDRYETLISEKPELFDANLSRRIVCNLEILTEYAREHGVVVGVAAETPFVLFVVDLVESHRRDGHLFPYMRVISRAQLDGGVNVVVLGTIEDSSLGNPGDIVLVEQERHALGTSELELPRGFGEPQLSGEDNALRELWEETGYLGEYARFLGTTASDSGITDSFVSFFHVPVVRRAPANREPEEAITGVTLMSCDALWGRIRTGQIRDAFTLQALALYEKS